MSSTKSQKEKPYIAAPRLAPRQTAASAARAARNATNRNLTMPALQRQSPSRAPASPSMKRKSAVVTRNPSRAESRTDMKMKPELESPVVDNPSVLILGDRREEREESDPSPPDNAETNNLYDVLRSEKEPPCIEQNVDRLECATRSPNTPITSRPQTPKSISSRPVTPRVTSRPVTPAHPGQKHGTPYSRPSTPQSAPHTRVHTTPTRVQTPSARPLTPTTQNHSARPLTPTAQTHLTRPLTPLSAPARSTTPSALPVPTSRLSHISHSSAPPKDEGDIKSTYSAKQRQFQQMKKELDLKQQAVLEVFDSLRNLRDRMSREGLSGSGEGAPPQELVVFNVADWTADEVAQLCRDAVSASNTEGAVEVIESVSDENALEELDSKVVQIPSQFAELCLQAFSARQELIDWIKVLVSTDDANCNSDVMQRIAHYNEQGLQLCDALRELKSRADDAVDAVANISKRVCRDQSALIAVGKSLVREVASLRQDLEGRGAIINEMRQMRAEADTTKALEDTRQELEDEKAARLATKDKLATAEYQLRQTRIRVTKMDRQLREAEASIASLTGTVKILEDQSRQREVQLEARARKLKESLKTGEVASGQLAQHRDALQMEVIDLKDEIEKMTASHKSAINDLNTQLKELMCSLEQQRQLTQKEIELKNAAEVALTESQATIEELKAKITELENSKPNPDLPTEREMDLWAELQATKEALRVTEDEVTACKREKTRFLETLTKISESDNKVGMQQKLAAELLNKEEILGKMQVQVRELTKNIKLNEQKVIQYEQYVRDLQAHNRAVASSNCQEGPNGISYQDLQQEIMSLRMGLLEAVHRNEELSEMLAQKEQQLEQQDKTSRAQARVIKVREELINMLKNKETEQSRELSALQQDLEHRMKIVDEVNKQIAAKAEEIQELFATLENKQQQIHRLEKIVLALEEQQRRAQAQRTRHEEKIAALEHELAAGGTRRERKFLFF